MKGTSTLTEGKGRGPWRSVSAQSVLLLKDLYAGGQEYSQQEGRIFEHGPGQLLGLAVCLNICMQCASGKGFLSDWRAWSMTLVNF